MSNISLEYNFAPGDIYSEVYAVGGKINIILYHIFDTRFYISIDFSALTVFIGKKTLI